MRLPGEHAKFTESWRTPLGVVYAVTYIATCHEESWARRQTSCWGAAPHGRVGHPNVTFEWHAVSGAPS